MCAAPRSSPGLGLILTAGLLTLACCAAHSAEDSPQLLQEWPIADERLPATVFFWHRDTPDVRAEAQADPAAVFSDGLGVCSVHVASNPCASAADIQLNPLARLSLGRGGTYAVSLWVKASHQVTLEAAVIHHEPPFAPLGTGPAARFEAGPEWEQWRITFTSDSDVSPDEPIRAPYVGLGLVPAGSTVWVAGVTLWEIAPPPPPLPLLMSDELLHNPDFAVGTDGWAPQTAEISPADGACLVTKRTARWGTPIQDIREALTAHGIGFYEFGAAVRAVWGKGETFAVIHLRDATGDHWVTSETRPLRDTGYACLSAQRFVGWSGKLEAADIGLQTGAGDTQDIVVDDVSLRALAYVLQGKLTSSSGEAAGHPVRLACDGDLTTTWQASSAEDAWIEASLGQTAAFNTCILGEERARIRSYVIETWDGDNWAEAFAGGTVLGGLDRLHFAPATGSKVRLRVTASDGPPAISEFAAYATAVREKTVRLAAPRADPSRRGERPLVGAIRWDGWCGDKSPVGLDLERVMSPERYHYRLPFYAEVIGPEKVQARCVTQETMDREIAYARATGIDYWAFDWYRPDDGLSTARSLYLSSTHRDDVKWCLIAGTGGFLDEDRRWLVEQFRTSNYQKVLGDRPLVYIFDANLRCGPMVKSLRDDAAAAGCPSPFIVLMGWGPVVAEAAAATGADAIGAYVNPIGDGATFAAAMVDERGRWEALRRTGCQVVPTITTGWDPRPFLDCPVPWYPGGSERNWGERATADQVAEQLAASLDFVAQYPGATLANAVLIYAWNENAEGGWIIPTLPELGDGGVPLRLDALRSVLKPEAARGSGWPAP